MQKAIADSKLEWLEVLPVLHDVECVEDVEAKGLGMDKHVRHTFSQAICRTHIIVRVGNLEGFVLGVVENLTRQVVEGEHVGEWFAGGTSVYETVHDFVARHEEVLHLFLAELNEDLAATAEVGVQHEGNLWDVFICHWAQVGNGHLRG